jgi:aspartate aminotransferase-like enzyme
VSLTIADCVTSRCDAGELDKPTDIACSCSKRRASGLAPITVSAPWVPRRSSMNHSWYLDLKLLDKYTAPRTATPHRSISMFYALREALVVVSKGVKKMGTAPGESSRLLRALKPWG